MDTGVQFLKKHVWCSMLQVNGTRFRNRENNKRIFNNLIPKLNDSNLKSNPFLFAEKYMSSVLRLPLGNYYYKKDQVTKILKLSIVTNFILPTQV